MKLVKVEYLEETETAVFFNVYYETGGYWSKPKEVNRRAFFEKPHKELGLRYVTDFYWADDNGFEGSSKKNIIQEMILQYEKCSTTNK